MAAPVRVACIGECMVELALRDECDTARVDFAGDTYNTAVYLRREAGPDVSVAYVTALGQDRLSERMVARFAEEGLETDLIERRADRVPGLYAIATDTRGERSFTYWRDRSAARTLFLPPAEVTPEHLADFKLIYLSGITLAVIAPEARTALAAFLGRFRTGGGRVAFDSNYRPALWPDRATARTEISTLWRLADIGLPSLDDEIALFGDADANAVLARLADSGVKTGALKRGADGPLPIGDAGRLPDFPAAERVVDTTAAGDSFDGAYLAALIAGRPPAERLAAGHSLASRVIGHSGAILPRVNG